MVYLQIRNGNKTNKMNGYKIQSHNDLWIRNWSCDTFVRQNFAPIDVNLVFDNHIFSQNGHILHTNL